MQTLYIRYNMYGVTNLMMKGNPDNNFVLHDDITLILPIAQKSQLAAHHSSLATDLVHSIYILMICTQFSYPFFSNSAQVSCRVCYLNDGVQQTQRSIV